MAIEGEYLTELRDGTVKQVNPFTGTQVWTVPGRGNRPLGASGPAPRPLEEGQDRRACAFCQERYLETPPEKSRVIRVGDGFETRHGTPAEELFDTVAEFRRVPNLFEILSFDYWHLNYGYDLPDWIQRRQEDYLASPAGRAHVLSVVEAKLRASGHSPEVIAALGERDLLHRGAGFFGGGHDVVIARRHFVDGATDDAQLASSGTLTPDEHGAFIAYTVEAAERMVTFNRFARYVTVFQNWLRPAGASFDHLHKQLAAIDEHGNQQAATIRRVAANPNVFNDDAVGYAARCGLIIARNEHAIAFAGFGHRYPTIEVFSTSEASLPWEHAPEEIRAMSDLLHAMHAATGAEVASNEEWHYRPIDTPLAMPWRVMLKWRISTLAGFEGATKIYLNTIAPGTLRDRVVGRLRELRGLGVIAPGLAIADEAIIAPNPLRYRR
ncbi:MAG: DUF4921 family protein [Arachnia sp.]